MLRVEVLTVEANLHSEDQEIPGGTCPVYGLEFRLRNDELRVESPNRGPLGFGGTSTEVRSVGGTTRPTETELDER
jgi:hypothetical protein